MKIFKLNNTEFWTDLIISPSLVGTALWLGDEEAFEEGVLEEDAVDKNAWQRDTSPRKLLSIDVSFASRQE